MKLDSLSSLAEIMPYYGTLDQVCRIMSKMSLKSKKNFGDCEIQLGKIIKRKKTQITFKNFLKMLNKESDKLCRNISMFEIDLVRVRTLEDFKLLNSTLANRKMKESIYINRLQLPLRVNDDFDMTYEEACVNQHYTEEDRKLDKEYNKTIELAENLNIKSIESFIYLNEIKNRNIQFVDRVICFIGENMNQRIFLEQVDCIKQQRISVNKILLVLNTIETFDIYKQNFKYINSFKSLPCKIIEVFANSESQDNIMMPFVINHDYFHKRSFLINLKPTDKLFDYMHEFIKPNCFNDDYFIYAQEGMVMFVNWTLRMCKIPNFKAIRMKIKKGFISHPGVMINIFKCDKMVIEFNAEDNYRFSADEINKCVNETRGMKKLSYIALDPASVKIIYEGFCEPSLLLKYPNI